MKFVLICLFIMLTMSPVYAGDVLSDSRYCGTVERDANGKISRSRSLLTDFKHLYACPSTGKHYGSCPGWAIDHVIPLACGGCDAIENLQWLPDAIKSAAGKYPKDRWERKIYCGDPIEIVK
jgi:5-methylcytosine-specific restriction endonuclease McrA